MTIPLGFVFCVAPIVGPFFRPLPSYVVNNPPVQGVVFVTRELKPLNTRVQSTNSPRESRNWVDGTSRTQSPTQSAFEGSQSNDQSQEDSNFQQSGPLGDALSGSSLNPSPVAQPVRATSLFVKVRRVMILKFLLNLILR